MLVGPHEEFDKADLRDGRSGRIHQVVVSRNVLSDLGSTSKLDSGQDLAVSVERDRTGPVGYTVPRRNISTRTGAVVGAVDPVVGAVLQLERISAALNIVAEKRKVLAKDIPTVWSKTRRPWANVYGRSGTENWLEQTRRLKMADQPLDKRDEIADFEQREITYGDDTKLVYKAGIGPAVIVMTEMPGITPEVARYARWVRDAGFTVWMPSLFGRDGEPGTMDLTLESMDSPCIRREFTAFAKGEGSPMVAWLRSLAADAHVECGGLGVGAIGMCFTGNFGLAMMLETSVLAPVMCQPSLPLDDPAVTGLAPETMVAIRQRLDEEDLTVLAYRFEGDSYCTAQRFEAFEEALGDRLHAQVLPDSAAAPGGWTGVPHSVVTTHLIDEAGQPTVQARDEILRFFAHRLNE